MPTSPLLPGTWAMYRHADRGRRARVRALVPRVPRGLVRGEQVRDPLGSMPISERIVGASHRRVFGRIIEQTEGFGNNPLGVGPDQPRGARLDALGALGG